MARGWVNLRWCASAGLLPQTRHGCDATNLRWSLSRCRRTSLIVSTLLSILAGAVSARRCVEADGLSGMAGFDATRGGGEGVAAGFCLFCGAPRFDGVFGCPAAVNRRGRG